MKTKTLQEVKDHVAQLEGYPDWFAIDNSELSECERNALKVSLIDEIAKYYAREEVVRMLAFAED